LNVKLGRWEAAVELVNEGITFSKALIEIGDDGLRKQLIAIGAQAKHVPEGFLTEAVNALNGWGDESGVWNLSFWDFSIGEIKEEIHVLKNTTTLKHLLIDHFDDDRRYSNEMEDTLLAQFILAVVSCQSLELLTVATLDFDPRKVWRRIKKRSFLETSWYASALNFTNILENAQKPDIASYRTLLHDLNTFSKKVVLCLVVLGNECDGVDLSENNIDVRSITAFVRALRWLKRPKFARQVSSVILRSNALDADTCRELAKTWNPEEDDCQVEEELGAPEADRGPVDMSLKGTAADFGPRDPNELDEIGVTHLDVSMNALIGDEGFDTLCASIAQFEPFKVLQADTIGMGALGCEAVVRLASTQLELLNISNNAIGPEGAEKLCRAVIECRSLHTLEMDNCNIDGKAAKPLSDLLEQHGNLRNISLNHNKLGSQGAIEFCVGAAESVCLKSVHLAYNGIVTEDAAEAIAEVMRHCETLLEMNLSGNHFHATGAPHIGSAIEHSRVLTMFLEDMGFTDGTIDDFLDHGAAETQDLQVMILSNNPVGDEGLGIIAECLSIGLTDLSLSKCSLTGASQSTLLNLVSLSPNLRSLDLSYNDLGPHGCSDMVMWMTQNEKENFSLRILELAGCNLGDEGFYQLVPVLGSLTYMGAKENGITSAGLTAVMNSNHMIQLRCLDLADNNIGEPGVHALTERFQQEHKRSLWNPKQLTSTIDQVILSNNSIPSGLAASTEAFLKIHNPLLTVVW
jgi:Ran GTPase-activating protein (RanGAP) involved in mRNA processing and transport